MKRKRLLFAVALVTGMLGWNSAQAQEDITSDYLTNADLASLTGWNVSGSITGSLATDGEVNTVEFYHSWSANAGAAIGNSKDFTLSQTITLPAGNYRIAVNAFYREGNGNGTNTKAYIFAGTKQQYVHAVTSAEQANLSSGSGAYSASQRKDDRGRAAYAFSIGDFSNAFDFDLGTEQEITLGFSGYIDTYCSWCILGPVKLYKYSLEDYLVDYRAKVAEAEALYDSPMNGDVLSALQAAVVEESTFNLSSEVTAAIQTLTSAINAANTSIANYVTAKGYLDKASTLDAVGQAAYAADASVSALQSAYDDRNLVAVSTEQVAALDAALINAAKSQTTEGADMTLAIVNPSFENGLSGWTNSGMAVQGNTSFEKDGNNYVEKWQPNGTFSVKQSLTLLSAGVYQITAKTKARGVTSAKLFANGVEKSITVGDVTNTTVVEFACDANSTFEFGFEGVGTGAGNSWLCVDDFHLQFVGGLPEVAAVEGKMNADVATAQSNAISTYNGNKTVANYNAAVAAVAAAQASVDAYLKLGDVITKLDIVLADATSATESADAYQAIKTAYNNGSIADADIPANVISAYEAVISVIKSQTAASADFTFAIQNQSFEYGDMTGWTATASSDTGVRETANATYKATGADGSYLFNTWWQGVPLTQAVAGLPNGEYTLTASVASDGATIYLLGNGEHNEGTETGGSYPSSDVMQEATFTFLVKDGTATIGVVGGADGTAGEHKDYVEAGYWWYKADNFRLVKNRDLTEEEMAVVPTAIALYNGETEVTEAIKLTATDNTVTLTPAYTPADATEGYVTWTSSDETVATVADGVVTGVAPGTATITVTSTLDENVSATATVNVSYPESTVPETTFVNDGPTRTVSTLGENLIKNGSFEYPNAYYGWTYGTGSTTPITSAKFDIASDNAPDGNQYLKALTNEGGAAAGSINTSWEIEPGKTYVFGYKVKSTAASTGNQYLGASLNTTKGQENNSTKMANPQYNANEWTDVKYIFESGDFTYLVFNARWLANSLSFDNFYLCEATTTTEGNVDYATAAIPTSNVGTGAFQYSQNAIDVANALVQGEATVEDVENAYEALTTLNAPEEGKLYNVVNITSGFAHNGKALTFKSASDADLNANTTAMGWTEEPGSVYPQGVKFTAVEGVKNGYKMSYTRADGNVVYVSTGKTSGLGSNTQQIRPTTDASKALTVEVQSAGDNKWYLFNTEDKHSIGSSGDQGFYTAGGSNKDVKIQEAVNNEVTLKPSAANKYGTLILPFDAEAPENVTIYSVSAIEGTSIALNEETSFAANTPYIVYYGAEINETVGGIGSAYTDAEYSSQYLTGVFVPKTLEAGTDGMDNYVLQTLNNKQAFYKVVDPITITANRAYLTNESNSNGVKALYFGGEATAINALDALTSGAYEGIYTVDGMKLNRIEKGVNILKMADGTTRKVVVK